MNQHFINELDKIGLQLINITGTYEGKLMVLLEVKISWEERTTSGDNGTCLKLVICILHGYSGKWSLLMKSWKGFAPLIQDSSINTIKSCEYDLLYNTSG